MRRVIMGLVLLLSACAPRTPAVPSAPASAAQPLEEIALRYRLRAFVTNGRGAGAIGGCDDWDTSAAQRGEDAVPAALAELAQMNPVGLQVLQQTVGVTAPWRTLALTDQVALVHELQALRRFSLTPTASGAADFRVIVHEPAGGQVLVTGTMTAYGAIVVTAQAPWSMTCPVCLAATTQIATPDGAVLITELAIGDLVWTRLATGEQVARPVLRLSRTAAPPTHQLIEVTLSDGRQLRASWRHPTSTGQPLGGLAVGDQLDGALIQGRIEVPYGTGWTYDLLPAGDTGWYWADGVLLSSTLHP